jgi:hypothetical protein
MIYENFLTNLYFGYPQSSDLTSFKIFDPDDKALEIINAYRSVSREYPSNYLEEQGMVPSDLMEKLRSKKEAPKAHCAQPVQMPDA